MVTLSCKAPAPSVSFPAPTLLSLLWIQGENQVCPGAEKKSLGIVINCKLSVCVSVWRPLPDLMFERERLTEEEGRGSYATSVATNVSGEQSTVWVSGKRGGREAGSAVQWMGDEEAAPAWL